MIEKEEIVVLITAPDAAVARQIAASLVESRLAACVNLVGPIQSIYSWEGLLHQDEEILLIVKTMADLFDDQLVPAVKALHPYQLPEIIALPIEKGSQDYLSWMAEVTH